jgi:hypothetical protein
MAGEYLLGALRAGVRALGAAGVDYALFGGVAVNAWGRIRATRDAGILQSADQADFTPAAAMAVSRMRFGPWS